MPDYEIEGYMDYTARRNDSYDALALKLYNDEYYCHIIARANPDYLGVLLFEGGEKLRLPLISEKETVESLPPWRR